MIESYEYAGPYLWTEAKERLPSDYGPPQLARNKGFQSETEEADYWDKLSEMENDTIKY